MIEWLFTPRRDGVVEVLATDGEFYASTELSFREYSIKYLTLLFDSMVQRINRLKYDNVG